MKCGNLNFLELSGPLQACNGTALPLPFTMTKQNGDWWWTEITLVLPIAGRNIWNF
jgi:hypothetical protein